ncbi:heat shock factor-binding protein 1-like, partial [Antrostomus carolinensis]|uniref:heat shock factor-binding protein 1-like n=1 Tax=Antrostomus carolinensis TaxID=279965 RepID=UPI0010A98A64
LRQLQEKFQALAEKMTLRVEEMGERIDDLEKHVADLMTEAGIENTDEELRVKKLKYYFMYFHLVLRYALKQGRDGERKREKSTVLNLGVYK